MQRNSSAGPTSSGKDMSDVRTGTPQADQRGSASDQTGALHRHSKQFGPSHAEGGQVPVVRTAEGDRRDGRNEERGFVSPLGHATAPNIPRDESPQTENKQQQYSGRPSKDRGLGIG